MWKAAVNLISQIRGLGSASPGGARVPETGRVRELERLCETLDYRFRDFALLDQALTHSSYSNEMEASEPGRQVPNYESLEFLGDSILGLIISEFLFLSYPEKREGFLSQMKSQLVSTTQLSELSRDLGLGEFLNLGRGEQKTGGRNKKAILADLFESLLAAIYLDGGFKEARIFVLRLFKPCLESLARGSYELFNSKSALQEKLHEMGLDEPEYRVIEEEGPQHNRRFLVEVCTRGHTLAEGRGTSKKAAEQDAAGKALEAIEKQDQFLR